MRLRETLGLDGAVTYTFLARFISILGSTGTVLLIVRFLSPAEQGYYYTLLSLVSLQVVFEMGFSFVIQQLAAHECVHLRINANGTVSGNSVSHARLASALQLSVRWYSMAAAAMGLLLGPLGMLFFARHEAGTSHVAWLAPWLAAVGASMLGLWCTPFYSFLEGCGQVRAVAAMRLRQSILLNALAWAVMLLHHGLFSPAMVILGQAGVGVLFLASRRKLLLGLLRHSAHKPVIQWSDEVWPFQWRIAVSSMCGYFTVQVFIPILFALRGPVDAGQMGMSISITGYMTALALAWTSTKTTPFGRMIALHEFHQLDRLFLRTMTQSLIVFSFFAVCFSGAVALLIILIPSLAARMVSLQILAVLMIGAGANLVTQSFAVLLRSFKSEPFLIPSLAVALLTVMLVLLTATKWGNAGAAFSYLVATAFVGLPVACAIYSRARRDYLGAGTTVARRLETRYEI